MYCHWIHFKSPPIRCWFENRLWPKLPIGREVSQAILFYGHMSRIKCASPVAAQNLAKAANRLLVMTQTTTFGKPTWRWCARGCNKWKISMNFPYWFIPFFHHEVSFGDMFHLFLPFIQCLIFSNVTHVLFKKERFKISQLTPGRCIVDLWNWSTLLVEFDRLDKAKGSKREHWYNVGPPVSCFIIPSN